MGKISRCISRTGRMAKLHRAAKLEPYGLNGNQHTYILNICRNPGISQEQLARRIFVNKSNVARQLACLEQNGFVRREQSNQDRRQMLVYPTDKAMELLPVIRQMLDEWEDSLLEGFTDVQREQARDMLERIMQNAATVVEQEWSVEDEE